MVSVLRLVEAEPDCVVVLSAVSGTTNALQAMSNQLYAKNISKYLMDLEELKGTYHDLVKDLFEEGRFRSEGHAIVEDVFRKLVGFAYRFFSTHEEKEILSFGERLSTRLFDLKARQEAIEITLLDSLQYIYQDELGEPDLDRIKRLLSQGIGTGGRHLLQGYICRTAEGRVSNLQRGGSDYTASLVGEAIAASEIEIWTDIDGMHTNDPRVVEDTTPISQLSYNEASELAYFGAKVLHPQCVFPAQRANIPLRIRYTMDPQASGTLITKSSGATGFRSIAAKDGITAIKIRSSRMLMAYGFLTQVFKVFEEHRTPIDMITTSEVAVSLTIDQTDYLPRILEDLEALGEVEVDRHQAIICIVGNFIAESRGQAAHIFEALSDIPVRMVSYGGSKHNVSVLVSEHDKSAALQALHQQLFLKDWSDEHI